MSKKKEKNATLPYMINLVMGDQSGDGHGRTEHVTIISNLEKKDIEIAYKAGAKKTKVDLSKNIACDYEDNKISKEIIEKLIKFGFKGLDYVVGSDDCYSLWSDTYSYLWLFLVSVGNPDFKYEVINDDSPDIDIGGYGLFY